MPRQKNFITNLLSMSPSLSLYLSPHPSDQVSERPHASTTALQCSEENEVKMSLDHSISDNVTGEAVLDIKSLFVVAFFVMVRNGLRDEKVVWNGLRVEFEVADLERRERGGVGRSVACGVVTSCWGGI